MQLILTEEVVNLGKVGDLVNVKDGYGRNYLIPQQKAMIATKHNVARIEHEKRILAKRTEKLMALAKTQMEKLEALTIAVKKPVGEDDKLFGSVTSRDIERAIKEEGINDIDRKSIQLPDALKTLGVFKIPVKLAPGVYAKLNVWVLPE
jgi:large subunit ribosomal protein L9